MLGFCERKDGMDFFLDSRPTWRACSPFRFVDVIVILTRCFAVLLPCILVSNAIAYERSELLNSGSMRYEQVFEYVADDRSVMGSVMTREIDLRCSRGEGGAKLRASSAALSENLKLCGKPVCNDRAY